MWTDMKGGENVDAKVKELLMQQMELLHQKSTTAAPNGQSLGTMTKAMCQIARLLEAAV